MFHGLHHLAELLLSLSLSNLGSSLSPPCRFDVSWISAPVFVVLENLLLLPHDDYLYDDYNNYKCLLLLLFLLLLLVILERTSNYDDGDANSTKKCLETKMKPSNYPRTNSGTTDDESLLNDKESSYTTIGAENHC